MAGRSGRRGRGRGAALTLAIAIAFALTGCGDEREERVDLVIETPRLFDGERMVEDAYVAIRDGEIVAVGPSEDRKADGQTGIRIDATLLPGLIDLHTHDLGEAHAGSVVTTVRNVGTPDANLPLDPRPSGPRVLAAGPLLTAPRGYPIPIHGPEVAHVVRTREGARRYVRSLADRGAGVIKVSLQFGFPVITFDVLRAIVEEAHAQDLRVTAHVGEGRGARMALRAGVDELAHMPCGDEPELMRELAEAGLEIVGTLHVAQLFSMCPGLLENASAFVAAGGTLLYGSDYGVPGIPGGVDVTELELLAESGLGRIGALRAATSEAAKVLAVDGLGRLVAGARGDVVAVRGDPTRDLDALTDIVLLVHDGKLQFANP